MLDSVSFSYSSPVLEDITIPSDSGITAIAGRSGCGKTTLLRILAGLLSPESGVIDISVRTGMVFQEPRLFPWFTVERNLKAVMKKQKLTGAEADSKIEKVLETVGLGGCREKYPAELSGGMRMRVAIARSLVYDSGLLLMDEPFNGLDVATKASISGVLRRLADDGLQIVFVSHIPEDIIDIADRVYILSDRPARVIDHFENRLIHMRGYERRLRTEMIDRIVRGISGEKLAGTAG